MDIKRLEPKNHWYWTMPVNMSQGWIAGDYIFVGGQMSATEDGTIIGVGDIEKQTRTVFQNITNVLAEANADWSHVIKLNTYYVFSGGVEEVKEFWETMTKIRMEFLVPPGPAATAVRVAGLIYDDALIEADVVAINPNRL